MSAMKTVNKGSSSSKAFEPSHDTWPQTGAAFLWLRVVAAIVNKCKSRRISFSLRLISLRLTCCALRLPFADVFDSIAVAVAVAVAVLTHCWPKRKRRCRFESESCEIHQWPEMEQTAQARELGKPSWEIWETHVAHLRGNRQMRPSYNWAPSPPLPAAQLVQCIMFYGFIYAVYAALKVTTHTHTHGPRLCAKVNMKANTF